MKYGETRVISNRFEIQKDCDSYGNRRYTVIDRKGYLGRTRLIETSNYFTALERIREAKVN